MDSDEIAVASATRSSPPSRLPSDSPPETATTPPTPVAKKMKPERRLRWPEDYKSPSSNRDSMKSDFAGFGFGSAKIKNLMSKREADPDITMLRANKGSPSAIGRQHRERVVRKTLQTGKYEPLVLSERSSMSHIFPHVLSRHASLLTWLTA